MKKFTNFKNFKPTKIEMRLKKERIMNNVDELYEKYYNACKNDYGNDDELKEDKKKKADYKQFELFDKTDRNLKSDEETKKTKTKEIEYLEKNVDKKGFIKYFRYEPTALVRKLLCKNTQDLKKVWMRLNNKRLN